MFSVSLDVFSKKQLVVTADLETVLVMHAFMGNGFALFAASSRGLAVQTL